MDARKRSGQLLLFIRKRLIYKQFLSLAERVGFEPTCRNYPTIRFRVGAVMTTSVPLQIPDFLLQGNRSAHKIELSTRRDITYAALR